MNEFELKIDWAIPENIKNVFHNRSGKYNLEYLKWRGDTWGLRNVIPDGYWMSVLSLHWCHHHVSLVTGYWSLVSVLASYLLPQMTRSDETPRQRTMFCDKCVTLLLLLRNTKCIQVTSLTCHVTYYAMVWTEAPASQIFLGGLK